MKIFVDPAWHENGYSEAFIDTGDRFLIEKYKGCDVGEVAKWLAGISKRYPEAEIQIDPMGPGRVLIQLLSEHLGIRVSAAKIETRITR